tara:strand:+ start:13560 stop:14195 length:636 start_codon:yes stop_codon:yes gene_type:complete
MSDVIWLKNPLILIKEKYIFEILPKSSMSKTRKINAITRLIIIITILAFLLTNKLSYIISGIVSLALIYLILYNKQEGFQNSKKNKDHSVKSDNTSINPLNNVIIGDNPKREQAAMSYEEPTISKINESVKKMIQEQNSDINNINDKLFRDLGENMEFDRSMRQFYTTANTTVPNDQHGFAEYCYGDMSSGKTGDKHSLLQNSIHLHKSHL